ncbi:MAG TPA: hypothetical protein VMS14_07570 [Ilumatobacteraceae bacterium]|nr:hypothetical protein [Ilumatobacteraceae bacterium]
MTRLRKHDVERLLASYDSDPVGALTVALRTLLDRPGDGWASLLAASGLSAERVALLRTGNQAALDELAAELNELRTLPPHSTWPRTG